MPVSILPGTGVWAVRDGVWQPVLDPTIVGGGVWGTGYQVAHQVADEWKTSYLRPLPVTILITSPPLDDLVADMDQNSGTITGTVFDVVDRPVPGVMTVDRVLSDGTVTPQPDVTVDANGDWVFTFDFGLTPLSEIGLTQSFRFSVAEALPLLAATVDSPVQQINSVAVTVTFTEQPSGSYFAGEEWGTDGRVAGTALRDGGSPAPGTIRVNFTKDDGTDSFRDAVTVAPDGTWETFGGAFGFKGARTVQAYYDPLPGGFEDPVVQTGNTVQIGLSTPSFSKGSVGNTSIAMSCGSVSGASGYQFYEGGTRRYSGSSRSYTRSGLSNYRTYYNWKVRSYGYTPAGAVLYSGYSSEHDARTGRPKKTDSGSYTGDCPVSRTGSWRSVDNWAWLGDKIAQGYYTRSYGGYRGVMDFGGSNAVRDWLRARLGGGTTGSNRQTKGNCSSAYVFLWRPTPAGNAGTNGAIWCSFRRTDNAVGSGTPNLKGTAYSTQTGAYNTGKWMNIGHVHGQYMGDGGSRGIVIENGTDNQGYYWSDNYCIFNGKSAGVSDGDLRLSWSWSYETQSAISGTWTS